ncbi:MAG: Ig-like domain-containing protein, partial [Myxococcota bacterium]
GADGYARFTPHAVGTYRFELIGGTDSRELVVIDNDALPFHNYNYYPSTSQAIVADELWVANVYRPTVTRIATADRSVVAEIAVGSWPVAVAHRDGMDTVVVAQRASDTLGLIDVASGRIVDAVWVGDEPSNVVLSPDGALAYVTLAGDAQVAVVDLAARAVVARIVAVADPLGLAITSDGRTLFAAGHRTGETSRFPFPEDPVAEERDIAIIDTASREVTGVLLDVAATITALRVSEDDTTLYVARVSADNSGRLSDTNQPAFRSEVAAFDIATAEQRTVADLSRQDSSAGFATAPHGMTEAGGLLWVVAESSDVVVALDPLTLAEQNRAAVPGRPRHVVALGDRLFVHAGQDLAVVELSTTGEVIATVQSAVDPRPADLAIGQKMFTGAGIGFAEQYSCNSCHSDGRGDTMVWPAGPFEHRLVSRPLSWLEGTAPLGWDAYNSNVRNIGFNGLSTINRRPTTEQGEAMTAYLGSLMPPPAGNSLTRRDGSLSELAEAGRVVYDGVGACSGCHPMPLATSQQQMSDGITEDFTDIPSLVGAYRNGVWLKDGSARTVRSAVVAVAEALSMTELGDSDIDALTRYLLEMTGRDFFVLRSIPALGSERSAVDRPIELTFSYPVWADPSNLDRIALVDGAGQTVATSVTVDGRQVMVQPNEPLQHSTEYTLRIAESFESFDQRAIYGAYERTFITAAEPLLRLGGDYLWTVELPQFDFASGGFDLDNTSPVTTPVAITETPSGAALAVDYTFPIPGLPPGPVFTEFALIDGDQMTLPPLPVSVGP